MVMSDRFGQRDTSILMTSSLKNPAEQQDEDRISLRDGEELRCVWLLFGQIG